MQSEAYDADHDMNNPTFPVPATANHTTVSQDTDMEPGNPSSQNGDTESLPDLVGSPDSSHSSSEIGQNAAVLSSGYRSSPVPSQIPTPLGPHPAASRSSNRRARVDDDEDDERDRRHPSQRIGSPNSLSSSEPSSATRASPSPTPSSQDESQPCQLTRIRSSVNTPSLPRMGLDQVEPNNPAQNAAHDAPTVVNNDVPNLTPPPAQQTSESNTLNMPPGSQDRPQGGFTAILQSPRLRPSPPLAIILPLGNAHRPVSGNDNGSEQSDFALFTELMMRLGLLGALLGGGMGSEPEGDDPERAKNLVTGLEEVPIGLVKRLHRVGGTDDPDGSRDTMCAICWDQLLDEAGFRHKQESNGATPSSPSSALEPLSSSTSASPPKEEPAEPQYARIVALPCAHVFHADCLIPWFSRPRQTTCPTCRFNIDPENLTRTRRRRSAPMRPAESANTASGQQQPNQGDGDPARPSNDTTAPQHAGQDGNENTDRLGPHFIFGDVRIPVVVAAPSFISVGGVPRNDSASAQGGPNDARNDQHLNENNGNNTTDRPSPTVPLSPTDTALPSTQPIPETRQDNGRGIAHGIVFGFDVLLGAPPEPRRDGDAMDVDDGAENGNNDGDGDWFRMMMRDVLAGRGEGPTPNADNAGQENAENEGEPRPNPGFPRFINMNLRNGESLHIASGMGRTMGEAIAQLLSSMAATGGNPGTANSNAGPGSDPPSDARMHPATDTAAPAAADAIHNGPTPQDGQTQNQTQAQNQNNRNQQGGIFTAMGSFPFQIMTQMFGFGLPFRGRRSQNQGQDQNQPSEPATDAPSQAEVPQPSQTSDTPPSNDARQERAQTPGAPPWPATGDNPNNDGLLMRLVRNMLAGNPPPPMTSPAPDNTGQNQRDNNDTPPPPPLPRQPQIHFLPPGFFRTESSSASLSNESPSEKRQWTPPPAPGPTLRERIEKREREVGLRCCDMSCGVGPSDEDPLISVTEQSMKQLVLKPTSADGSTEEEAKMCPHTFHPSCLVSAERVALRGADAPMIGDDVEVSCSVCRAAGRVSREDWATGVQQLT